MERDTLSAAIEVLEKVAMNADEAVLEAATAELQRSAKAEARLDDVKRIQSTLKLVRQSLHDHTLSEKGLNLLIETTHDLSKTLDLQGLFHTIVSRARSLVGANIAWVTILDDENDLFRTVAAEGYLSPATTKMTSRFEYGAVGLIMRSKGFFDTQDYLNDTRFRHMPELDKIFRTENIVSLAGFPILSDGEVHGFLFVADRYARKLSGREISVLGSFALHAGVAMRNANAFTMLSEALDEAERNRNALIEHIQRVEASAIAHDEMTSLLASGGELHMFLQRMANQIGGSVFLLNDELGISEEFTTGTYRGQLAARIGTSEFDNASLIGAASQSRHSGRSVVMRSTPEEQCRVIALHGSAGRGDCLVICHQGELDAIEIRNLERSAVALSIAKMWNEKRETEKLIASSTLLRHLVLVTPPDPPTISAVRDRLGLDANEQVTLALITLSGLDRPSQTAVIRDCASRIDILVDLLDDAYVGIGPKDEIRKFLDIVSRRAGEWQAGGIVSDPFTDVTEAAENYARLNQTLRVVGKMKPLRHFVAQSEIGFIARMFETGDPARLTRYMEEILSALDTQAPRQAGELKKTLLCFLDRKYNIKRTAEDLGVHINTVRQRLDTLRQMTGGWEDPVRALEIHLALRLEALLDDGARQRTTPDTKGPRQ